MHWPSTAVVLNRSQDMGSCDTKMDASLDLGTRI